MYRCKFVLASRTLERQWEAVQFSTMPGNWFRVYPAVNALFEQAGYTRNRLPTTAQPSKKTTASALHQLKENSPER